MGIFRVIKRWYSNIINYKSNLNNVRNYNIWLFGEWFGKKCSDNSLYFANYVAEYGDKSLELYWICNHGIDTSKLHNRIIVVDKNSERAIELQKSAGVAVMNQGYDDFSDLGNNYLGNAITVNLWHGIMWKKIGYDSYQNNLFSNLFINSISKTKQFTFFCSPSEKYKFYFSNAFKCNSNTNAINAGLPRNTIMFDKKEIALARSKILQLIKSLGFVVDDNVKILTYMPTFRDKNTKSFSFNDLNDLSLNSLLQEMNCIIIQKAHEVNINRGVGYGNTVSNRIINIDNIQPQELLAATDILITDYSSCFFDFLLLDRPIIQFIYDYDYYSNCDRGLYYDIKDVDCGAIAKNTDELIKEIKEVILNPDNYSNKRKLIKSNFMTYECPQNCELIYLEILNKITLENSED